jgi:hypothetical protein
MKKKKFHQLVTKIDDEMHNISYTDLWNKISNYKFQIWIKEGEMAQQEEEQNDSIHDTEFE